MYDKGLEQNFSQSSLLLNPSTWLEEKVSDHCTVSVSYLLTLSLSLSLSLSQLTYNPKEGQNLFPVSILLETQSAGNIADKIFCIFVGNKFRAKFFKSKDGH